MGLGAGPDLFRRINRTAVCTVHTVQRNGGNFPAPSSFKYHTFLFHDFSFLHFATWSSFPDGSDVVDERVGEEAGPRSAAAGAGDHLALGAGAGAVVPATLQHRGEGWNKKEINWGNRCKCDATKSPYPSGRSR